MAFITLIIDLNAFLIFAADSGAGTRCPALTPHFCHRRLLAVPAIDAEKRACRIFLAGFIRLTLAHAPRGRINSRVIFTNIFFRAFITLKRVVFKTKRFLAVLSLGIALPGARPVGIKSGRVLAFGFIFTIMTAVVGGDTVHIRLA